MNVLIIGGGVAGLAIGWRLRQAGADVTILERGMPAMGATWASAGMIAVAGEMMRDTTPESEFGRHSSTLWPDFCAELEQATQIDIDYRRNGALIVADAGTEEPPGTTRLSVEAARTKASMLSPAIEEVFWAPEDAQVDNRALGRALARAFRSAGGTLSVNEAAVRFEVRDEAVTAVQTPFGRYTADAYLLTAGPWSGGLGGLPPEALPPIRPVKGEILAVAPPPGASIPGHMVRGLGAYLVPRTDRLLVGATSVECGFDTTITDSATRWLSERATALMPDLARWEVVERWAGLRPASPDGLPVLGQSVLDRLYVASGQFRNGILFAPAIAENMSRLVLGQAAAIPAFDPRRFLKGPGLV